MTIDSIRPLLEEELELGCALAQTLDRQRRALIDRDLDRLTELTGILEGQFKRFNELLTARADRPSPDRPGDDDPRLMRQIARIERRVMDLAQLNQELIADRLAYVGAMLGVIMPGETRPGYGPDGSRHPAAISRSA